MAADLSYVFLLLLLSYWLVPAPVNFFILYRPNHVINSKIDSHPAGFPQEFQSLVHSVVRKGLCQYLRI